MCSSDLMFEGLGKTAGVGGTPFLEANIASAPVLTAPGVAEYVLTAALPAGSLSPDAVYRLSATLRYGVAAPFVGSGFIEGAVFQTVPVGVAH